MEERRNYHRIFAQMHSANYDYCLELDGEYHKAKLLDVSQGGARLLLGHKPGTELNGKVGVVKDDYHDTPFMEGISYFVVWTLENMMGVSFSEPLPWESETLYEYCGNA